MISVYATTAKAPSHVKQQFSGNLQSTVDKIPATDNIIFNLFGDFNSHVGRMKAESDLWRGTLGIHGLEETLVWRKQHRQPSVPLWQLEYFAAEGI